MKHSSMTLLCPTTLEIQFHKCLITDDPLLPKMRLVGQLPSLAINVTGYYDNISFNIYISSSFFFFDKSKNRKFVL